MQTISLRYSYLIFIILTDSNNQKKLLFLLVILINLINTFAVTNHCLGIVFEMIEDYLATASNRCRQEILKMNKHELLVDLSLLVLRLANKPTICVEVIRLVEDVTPARKAVTTSTADLLVVAFNVSWRAVVNHVSYVGLVDAHSEGYCGHYNVDQILGEVLLNTVPFLDRQAGMVGFCFDADPLQACCDLVSSLSFRAVNNGRAVERVLLLVVEDHELSEISQDVLLAADTQVKVGPVEGGDSYDGIVECEQVEDVFADGGSGGGG